MKKINILCSAIAFALILSSCTYTTPLTASAAPIGNRVGVSTSGVLFGIQLNKSFGIAEAAHNGKITGGVGVVDYKLKTHIFGFVFRQREIIVYGN